MLTTDIAYLDIVNFLCNCKFWFKCERNANVHENSRNNTNIRRVPTKCDRYRSLVSIQRCLLYFVTNDTQKNKELCLDSRKTANCEKNSFSNNVWTGVVI